MADIRISYAKGASNMHDDISSNDISRDGLSSNEMSSLLKMEFSIFHTGNKLNH